MDKAYTITAAQLQDALGLLQLWKERSMRSGQKRRDIAYNDGTVSGMVLMLALLGFRDETKEALREANREYAEQQQA